MPKILVLHDNRGVREKLAKALSSLYDVTVFESVSKAKEDEGLYDLYVCGQMGKYSDGLSYALDKKAVSSKVLIVGSKRKFSLIPFLGTGELKFAEKILKKVEEVLVT